MFGHNEIVRYIYLEFYKKLRKFLIKDILTYDNVEIRLNNKIKTIILIKNNRVNMFIYDNNINDIRVEITC